VSDVEQRQSRRLEFLRAVYDLADGTTGNSVRGEDVTERLGIDLHGDEFHGLAYFHEQEGNTQALESNWGIILITAKGITEAERAMTPESRQEVRERLLRAIYDLSNGNTAEFVYWRHVAPRLGFGAETAQPPDEVMAQADYLADSRLITIEVDDGTVYKITANGIDVAEGNKPEGQQPTQQFTFNAPAYGIFGSQQDFTFEQVIHDLDRQVEEHGGEDKEELRQMVAEIRRVLETQDSIGRSRFQRWSELANKHFPWLMGPLGSLLVNYTFGPVSGSS
jgi:hypothetical protein